MIVRLDSCASNQCGSSVVRSISQRRGIALLAAVVVLVLLSLMMSAIAWQIVASGRILQHREYELQADLLARAGIEVAAARLLQRPDGYHGELPQLIDQSSVTIEVTEVPSSPGVHRVVCVARYPTDTIAAVMRKQTRVFERVSNGAGVRLDCVASNDED